MVSTRKRARPAQQNEEDASAQERRRPQPLPMTQQARADLEQIAAKQVLSHVGGPVMALQDALNLDFAGQIARFVMEPGVHNVLGVEQSDKSLIIAATAIANRVSGANKPMVVLVKDMVASGAEVRDKMGYLLEQFDIGARFANDKSEFASFQRSHTADWLRGRTILLAPANFTPLSLLNDMIRQTPGASDLLVVLDESDSMWTHQLTLEALLAARNSTTSHQQWWQRLKVTERERQMYRLLGAPPLDYEAGSHVASFVQVSATHLATLHWQSCLRLPYVAHAMDPDVVKANGFATYDVFQPFVLDGEPQYLQPADVNKKTRHGLDLPLVRAFFTSFAQDDRPYRLMQVSLTSYINSASSTTALQVAAVAQELVPQARVLIKSGVGTTVFHPALKKIDTKSVEREACGIRLATMSGLLRRIDREPGGKSVPVIVVGMQCVRRCTSVRSADRVITHMLAVAGSGMTTADTEQLLARALGRTTAQRLAHGYEGVVTVLTTKADMDMVKSSLYGCTARFLGLSGTGRKEDLDRWRLETCPRAYAAVLETKRPHARRSLGVDAVVSKIRLEPAVQAPCSKHEDHRVDEDASSEQRQRRQQLLDDLFGEGEQEQEQQQKDTEERSSRRGGSSRAAEQRGLMLLMNHYKKRRLVVEDDPPLPPTTPLPQGNKLTTPLNQRAALERCKKILAGDMPGGCWSNESAVLVAASLVASDGFPFVEDQLSEAGRQVPALTQDTDELLVLAAGLALALDRASTGILQRLVDKGLLNSKAGMFCLSQEGWAQARSIRKHLA